MIYIIICTVLSKAFATTIPLPDLTKTRQQSKTNIHHKKSPQPTVPYTTHTCPYFYVQSLPDPLYKKIVDVIKDLQDISQICMKLQHLGGKNFSKSILSIHKPAIAEPFFVKIQCVTP